MILFFFQAEDGIRDGHVTGVQTCALPIFIRDPWPAMARTIWGDDQRFVNTYWSRFDGMYFAGDGARFDEDGDIWRSEERRVGKECRCRVSSNSSRERRTRGRCI